MPNASMPTFTHADVLAAVVAMNEATIQQYDEFIRTNERTACVRLIRFIKFQRERLAEANRLISAKGAELQAALPGAEGSDAGTD